MKQSKKWKKIKKDEPGNIKNNDQKGEKFKMCTISK